MDQNGMSLYMGMGSGHRHCGDSLGGKGATRSNTMAPC